jgi:ABC-type polysaccharide/polyol phosphate transport system ATPase subunit
MVLSVKDIKKSFNVYPRPRHWLFEKLSFGTKTYHKQVFALRGVSFELEKGRCMGVVGKNGAGKSTLLKIIAGISAPSSGEFSVKGTVASLLELGSGFHPEFTGRENLRLNGMIAGFDASDLDRNVEAMAEFSELGEFIDLPVRTYSDGMYLRLGFSLAQALEPDLFLIDEALAVGDEYFRSKCMRRMLEFKEQGKSLLIASHDLTMVRGLCDCAIYLKDGVVKRSGSPGDVIESYLDEVYLEALGSQAQKPSAQGWKRRGSADATVVSVVMKNKDGQDAKIFRTGEQVEIEFEYRVDKTLEQPLFGINIFRSDGVLVLSTNQECALVAGEDFNQKVDASFSLPIQAGYRGKVSYRFKNLLLAGRYQLSVNIFKGKSGACLPVDEVFDVVRFEVAEGEVLDRGVFVNAGEWRIG